MTDAEAIELGRRLLAAGGAWCEGMRTLDGELVTGVLDGAPIVLRRVGGGVIEEMAGGALPDLRDPATVAAALAEVRLARLVPIAVVVPGVVVGIDPARAAFVLIRGDAPVRAGDHVLGTGANEAEPIVRALEAKAR